MEKEKICDCGSLADWEQVGSTWICLACRNKDARKKVNEFKVEVAKLELLERSLQILKVDTVSINELLNKLKAEINRIEASVEEI